MASGFACRQYGGQDADGRICRASLLFGISFHRRIGRIYHAHDHWPFRRRRARAERH